MHYITISEIELIVASMFGLLAHFIVKKFRNEITCSLWQYLFVDEPGYTVATVLSIIASCLVVVGTGQIEDSKPHIIVALGFGIGWTLDSAIGPRRRRKPDPHAPKGHDPW